MAPPSNQSGDMRAGTAQEPIAVLAAVVSSAEPTAATATDEASLSSTDPKQISLNVRTLDHTTYPISVTSNASVLQLKELVAVETGVVFARQRLIFRGKVLKNDQSIASYSLEDGHTLHMVARAENAVATGQDATSGGNSTATDNGNSSSRDSNGNGRASGPSGPAPGRNNDEPDPTIGGVGPPNHVLMGATISLPEGSGVSMPFLSSMIANIMTSVHGGTMVPGHIVISEADPGPNGAGSRDGGGPTRASYAHFTTHAAAAQASAQAAGGARARRSRAEPSLRSLGSSSRSRGSASSSASGSSNMTTGLDRLRSRSENLLEGVRSNVENSGGCLFGWYEFVWCNFGLLIVWLACSTSDYDFTGLDEVQLDAGNNTDAAFLQSQLTQLEILLDHFRTRLHLLPVALRDLQQRSESNTPDQSQSPVSVSAIVRAIDTLQSVGESADILSRIARYLFIRHNPGFTGGIRLNEGDSANISASRSGGGTGVAVNTAAAAASATTTAGESNPRRSSSERRSSHRRRHSSSRSEGSRGSGDGGRTGGNALFSLLERMNESIRGVTAGLTGTTAETPAASAPAASSTTAATAQEPSGASQPGFADGPQISLTNLGAPLASVVFPISFADLNTNTNTWNFAELLNRLISEIPASTLFGVIGGDPVTIHQVMAQTGFALVSGIDVPPVSRATIRTWSHSLVNELRMQLRSQGIPVSILSQLELSRQSTLVDQLIRPIEPFVPDLVDFFLRATSASRTAAFGTSSIDFLGTMSRQFVRHMLTYIGGDEERLQRLLTSLLEYFGLDSRVALFAVVNFLDWTGGNTRRRTLEGGAESAPANKRRREEH